MFIESLVLINFRCFGPAGAVVDFSDRLTAFVGVNGSGKTAVMQALQRLFGVTGEHRALRRQDFHIPANEVGGLTERCLSLEAIIAFPELDAAGRHTTVPDFFRHMAADDSGKLKCRFRLNATWTDDGTVDGAIDIQYQAVRTFGAFTAEDCIELRAADRSRIQFIYVQASRDGTSQVGAFLRGRLWRSINWSESVKQHIAEASSAINKIFAEEAAVEQITNAIEKRWQQIHTAGTDTTPSFRPVDTHWQEFIRKVGVVFYPDESGRARDLSELSDGQRSLFHMAMVAAALDVESQICISATAAGVQPECVPLPSLTLIGVEEPENNLAPFYLSRIISQITELTASCNAQAVVSSHSASILARVPPENVRHFRFAPASRTTIVRAIKLPEGEEEASKFVRQAVRTYPELYFARFVMLGEGATEEVVLPRVAEALGFPIDRSFVAMVPLGGRHVNHLWKLLGDLDIPHATLLDLDYGRSGGAWGRIKTTCEQLLKNGTVPVSVFDGRLKETLDFFSARVNTDSDQAQISVWLNWLRPHGIFFSNLLDLDYSMLTAFPEFYKVVLDGGHGPSLSGDPRNAVLGEEGQHSWYGTDHDVNLRWYRYLFLGRGKPSTHVRVLNTIPECVLAVRAPAELLELIKFMRSKIEAVTEGG